MKKLLIPIIIGWVAIPPASAFIKCVAGGDTIGSKQYGEEAIGQIDWTSDYGATGIIAISLTAPTNSANGVYVAETIEPFYGQASSSSDGGYVYCYCKMLTPAVSKWVMAKRNTTTGNETENNYEYLKLIKQPGGEGSGYADCLTGCSRFPINNFLDNLDQ